MLYGEKLRFAREKMGLSRMEFAVLIGMTERSIANIENSKDEKVKLSYDKMLEVIRIAELPKGWWFYDDAEIEVILRHNQWFVARALPGKHPTLSDEEAKLISDIAKKLR